MSNEQQIADELLNDLSTAFGRDLRTPYGRKRVLSAIGRAAEAKKTYEQRVIELFSSWLDHWSIRVKRQTHEVYGAWDEVREIARKDALENK